MARLQSQFIGSYPAYAQESTGAASLPVFAAINEAYGQTNPNQRAQFGDVLVDKHGNLFMYVRASGALTIGQVVRLAVAGLGDVPAAGTISASTTTRRIFTNITTTLDEPGLGSLLASPGTVAGVGVNFLKIIKDQVAVGANTTFDISKKQIHFGIGKYDGDELAAIPTTGDPVAIVRPYNVVVNGASAAGMQPVGVALGTVTAAGGTLIQIAGIASVMCNGTTDITAGGLVVPGALGVGVAPTATPTAYEVAQQVGTALIAHTGTDDKLIPVQLSLQQRW